jgi:hypothetical protein
VPTLYRRSRIEMVGTLRFAHPTRLICPAGKRNLDAQLRPIGTTGKSVKAGMLPLPCMLVCSFVLRKSHARPRVQQAPGLPCAL